ncbi:protein of unknown function [Actinopolymorpha cephalotaxi]|uniref:HNH nuclease domain-containing protein n=1 Tax=Actinopolymorpha cephalotaxi TaxID=504797 RepID=A0A1I2ZGS7_9ACTN|nr:HNH endonuclease signature motif containing protein [Actinopolymorpha cephalotaxi]NYH81968.1 hypothetical protein [Actinopolymorpha cephalotaxi]SFH36709.1 protein of unknown function [Actinopolymorpha cephalotaxi]
MHSTAQDLPGSGGHGTVARLKAAVGMFRAGLDDALSTPTTYVEARALGELIGELTVEESRFDALKLGWVRQAEACDIGKTTGAATTAAWLRTAQRMGTKDSYATVNLARDLDRTITLTARAMARGELSFRHAQVIAAAITDLPKWISLEQRVKAEEYLIDEARRRNPDDVRVLGRALLQYLAPEEWEKRLGKELGDEEQAAQRARSLKYVPNGIPGSETVVIKLPVLEMEQLRKIIEMLIARDNAQAPDDRPLDQRRGDAFAELVAAMAEWEASPNRGRGRDCVTVLIHLQQLMNGIGFGTIDDLNPVRPMPCGCQTPDAKRQAQRQAAKRKARKPSKNADGTEDSKPAKATPSTGDACKPKNAAPSNAEPSNADPCETTDDTGPKPRPGQGVIDPDDTSGPTAEPADVGETGDHEDVGDVDDPDVTSAPIQPNTPAGTGDPTATPGGAETTATASKGQPDNEKSPPDQPDPPVGAAERIPAPRQPGQHPQPNTATGTAPEAEPGPGHDPEPEPHNGNPEPATGPGDWNLGAEDDDAEPEFDEGAAEPEAAPDSHASTDGYDRGTPIDNDSIDPRDGCHRCGGGGSARITGLRGEPLSVATIRRMACDANIIPVVLGGNGEVLDVGMADRFFTEAQRRALAVRDGSHCHFPDCQVPERRCVAHHMTAWDDLGPTDLDNGVLLCKSHHTFVHHKGWTVRMGSHGHPEYIPPEWVDVHQKVQRP